MEQNAKNDEEKSYEVKDKRRVNPDGTLRETEETKSEQDSNSEQHSAEPMTDKSSEAKAEARETETPKTERSEGAEFPTPRVYDLLQFMVGMLAEQAWTRMGIRLAPGQKEPETDLMQAKIAIDTIVFIVDKIQPHIGEEERRALRTLVSDLQINFVRLT
ncbi:MAG: DUF1844 domain-containing protein [Armatimonadetes bacterium]|nr:DUF1844 domain-containing protein [Armatimonadota bacterium]